MLGFSEGGGGQLLTPGLQRLDLPIEALQAYWTPVPVQTSKAILQGLSVGT